MRQYRRWSAVTLTLIFGWTVLAQERGSSCIGGRGRKRSDPPFARNKTANGRHPRIKGQPPAHHFLIPLKGLLDFEHEVLVSFMA
jgi:hypothetical protein